MKLIPFSTTIALFVALPCLAGQGGSGDVEATSRAKEAFLKQSGIQDQIDTTQHQAEEVAKRYVTRVGFEPVVAVVGFGYKTYKTHMVSFKVTKKQKIIVTPNSLTWKLDF